MTATKDRPLITKHQPGPKSAYASPPMDGPTTIAMLNIVEFSAMAFVSTGRSTISRTKDWREGASKAFTTPRQKARTMMCQGTTTWRNVSAARTRASSMLSGLRDDEEAAPRHPVGDRSAVEEEDPRRDAGRKTDVPEVRLRPGELVDEVPLRRGLHPRAEQRSHLTEEPQPIVGVGERGEGPGPASYGRGWLIHVPLL